MTENWPDTAAPGTGTPPDEEEDYTATEDGNALELVERVGGKYRYCPERGKWLNWDGTRGAWDIAGTIRERARALARGLPEGDREAERHRVRSLSAAGVSGTLRLAQTDERIVARLAELDADPTCINTPSGVVDLATGQTYGHTPANLLTKITAAEVGEQECPRFEAFIKETFGGDDALAGYIQRLLGHSLYGAVTEHVLPFAFGAGANGKSVLMKIVMTVLGVGEDGYAVQAPGDFLMQRATSAHPTEIARLKGARFVVCQEINAGQRFDEAKVKQLTGGDLLAGRFMRQDFFTFAPTHHLWIAGNHRPEVRDGGPAFWRRVRLIPFDHVVPVERRDPHLAERLVEEEGPAILRWLVDGSVQACRDGIGEPAAVITATKGYEYSEDTVARFVDEVCQVGSTDLPHLRIRVAELRSAYEKWCDEALVEPVSAKAFTQRVTDFGTGQYRSKLSRFYTGIRLKPDPDLELEEEVSG